MKIDNNEFEKRFVIHHPYFSLVLSLWKNIVLSSQFQNGSYNKLILQQNSMQWFRKQKIIQLVLY